MTATKTLHETGQSIWLDSISRELLESGTLARYAKDLSVTGLTSNPTIFERAISASSRYDGSIRERLDRFSRAFSFSSSFRRFAWSSRRPPRRAQGDGREASLLIPGARRLWQDRCPPSRGRARR